MANLDFNPPAGTYPKSSTLAWVISDQVASVAFGRNASVTDRGGIVLGDINNPNDPNALAFAGTYAANDTTASGQRTYFDGGFLKYTNGNTANEGTTFASLNVTSRMLCNALAGAFSPQAASRGNNNVLFLNEAATSDTYCIKNTNANGFKTFLDRICSIMGWTPTYKLKTDYGVGLLAPTLDELKQYGLVVFFSTTNQNARYMQTAASDAVREYSNSFGGVAVITGEGPTVNSSIEAYNNSNSGNPNYLPVANLVASLFGGYFTGGVARPAAKVSAFKAIGRNMAANNRSVWQGIGDDETVPASIGKEARIKVPRPTFYNTDSLPLITLPQGKSTYNFTVYLKDGTVEAYTFVYNVVSDNVVAFVDSKGNALTGVIDLGVANAFKFRVGVNGSGLGSFSGELRKNGAKVGDLSYTDAGGLKLAFSGNAAGYVRIKDGDSLDVFAGEPFNLTKTLTFKRYQPDVSKVTTLAAMINILNSRYGALPRFRVVPYVFAEMQTAAAHLNLTMPSSHAGRIQLLKQYFADTGTVAALPTT